MSAEVKVLHLNSMLTGGGTDDQCLKLLRGLRDAGINAWLFGREERELSRVAKDLGIPLFHPEKKSKLAFIAAAARVIQQEKITIVHGHHGRDLWPTILAAKFSGKRPKVVLTRHMAKSPSSWPSRAFLLRHCDAVIAVSKFTQTVLTEGVDDPTSPEEERHHRPPLRGDHSKIHVVYGGIETDRFRPADASRLREEWGLRDGDYAFAVVGGYDHPRGKGQREFLRAAAKIAATHPSARFLIVGRGTLEGQLRQDIQDLRLEGRAWLTPYCRDMPAAMNAIDCLVHPQIGTEAFGLVLCEAFACGKPVIASALDGIPEAFEFGGLGALVPPENIDALAAAMAAWTGKRATAGERDALHERIARGFSLSRMATGVIEIYQELLK
jgi:glycosyltransferase involved in cell wall biosynthesis